MRSTPRPTVLDMGFRVYYDLNGTLLGSVLSISAFISTKSILTTFLSWANLLTICIDYLPFNPYLNFVPVCPTKSGSIPSISKDI